ncbi:MAG: NAD-dependent deacylase [Desulfotalea sp.]
MKKLVILTGAGISAESGFATFRDSGGLWEKHDVMTVASPKGWQEDPELVNTFYNGRRRQLAGAKPNNGHLDLVDLEYYFDVQIITQNVDDLHERAGSKNILHLHGELTKVESCVDSSLVLDIGYRELKYGERAEDGGILRPHIVWFGEAVPAIEEAAQLVAGTDILVIIGTSLAVYPAAGLASLVQKNVPIYLIDPNRPEQGPVIDYHFIQEPATRGVAKLKDILVGLN